MAAELSLDDMGDCCLKFLGSLKAARFYKYYWFSLTVDAAFTIFECRYLINCLYLSGFSED